MQDTPPRPTADAGRRSPRQRPPAARPADRAGRAETGTRIHPDLPVAWEDADTLRVGFERAYARLVRPTPAEQRLLGALLHGVRTAALPEAAERAGATAAEADALFATLDPALVVEPAPVRRGARAAGARPPQRRGALRGLLWDEGRPAPGLREALLGTRLCTLEPDPRRAAPELVILVERFLEPLERAQRWLIAGIPHLLVRFTDRAVHVGPIVGPEGRPCHTCLSLALVDRDPALPALAAQLVGRTPASESRAASHLAAAYAAVLIRDWIGGGAEAHTSRVVFPTRGGRVSGPGRCESVRPHPRCDCGADDGDAR